MSLIPLSSLVNRPQDEERFLTQLSYLPSELKKIVGSTKTAIYITGLLKNYTLPPEKGGALAFIILEIAFAEKTMAQLSSIISTELQLPSDRAQKMASEIERDLFAPIILEYNQFVASKKNQTGTSVTSAEDSGAHNVLDLKAQPKAPLPPPMPPSRFPLSRE